MSRRIAIAGASGLVGAALIGRLQDTGRDEVIPLIHSSGNAWRLASRGLALRQVDLLDQASLSQALAGCTHVVNCSRGDDEVMIRGLRNLLAAAKAARVERFVHLSSVAVYGDPPPPSSVSEDAPAAPEKKTYGWVKLRQDAMVQRAASSGLNAVILCPPNIGGPFSYFLSGLVASLRTGGFALLEDGSSCCNLVDVVNLCSAIELALSRGAGDGTRYFVTDLENITWRDLIVRLAPLANVRFQDVPVIAREDLLRNAVRPRTRISVKATIRHLLSGEVRQTLRKDPLLRLIDQTLRSGFTLLGHAAENRVRRSVRGPLQPNASTPAVSYALCALQLRGVRHSSARAAQALGYAPPYAFGESMDAFAAWYRWHHGLDGPLADLVQLI